MKEYYEDIQNSFKTQVNNVYKITEFDNDFLSIAIEWLKDLENNLINNKNIQNDQLLPTKTINLLTTVLEQGPQREKYKPVYNQSVVLLVSYFASTVSEIFNSTLTYYLSHIEKLPKRLEKEEFKFSLTELSELQYDLSKEIGRMIARKSDISFQDMGSISKSFKRFFGITIEWNAKVSNIITAQACRHAIVHNGEIIDFKCANQVRQADNREIKKDLKKGESVIFDISEIKLIGESMDIYVKTLCDNLLSKIPNE